jgi:hypothetical protein
MAKGDLLPPPAVVTAPLNLDTPPTPDTKVSSAKADSMPATDRTAAPSKSDAPATPAAKTEPLAPPDLPAAPTKTDAPVASDAKTHLLPPRYLPAAPTKTDVPATPGAKTELLPPADLAAAPSKTDAPVTPDAKTELLPPADGAAAPAKTEGPELTDPGVVPANMPVPDISQVHRDGVGARLVKSRRINIDYEIKNVGPSGISQVELWSTRDGQSWTKCDIGPAAKGRYVYEAADEGLYGFTLQARNGSGYGKEPPKPGDHPQMWIEVDRTRPTVELTAIHTKCTDQVLHVVIQWKAADKNLGPQPITISYAEKPDGPWRVIADNLPNTGRHKWLLPPDAPARFRVKVEAVDLAGNIGTAQTPKPVFVDRSRPTVVILDVEGAK